MILSLSSKIVVIESLTLRNEITNLTNLILVILSTNPPTHPAKSAPEVVYARPTKEAGAMVSL